MVTMRPQLHKGDSQSITPQRQATNAKYFSSALKKQIMVEMKNLCQVLCCSFISDKLIILISFMHIFITFFPLTLKYDTAFLLSVYNLITYYN